jgi:hypothetical protein
VTDRHQRPNVIRLNFPPNQSGERSAIVEAISLDDGETVASLRFRDMAHWLFMNAYHYIAGTNGIWARVQ